MQALNDLTFGVEFEFIVRVPIAPYRAATFGKSWCLGTIDEPESMGDPQLSKPNVVPSSIRYAVHLEIAQTLRDASIPCNKVGNPNDFSMWAVTHDNSIRPHKGQPPNYLGLDDAEVGVELKTRILPFCEKSLEEVGYALKVIKEKFQVRTNESTGLHVHIGRDNPRDSEDIFALSTLKNLICLVTIFEAQIESIHPSCRINNYNCRPVRDCFPETRSLHYALTQINAQCTISDLVALMSIYGNIVDMSGNSAYNLRQLLGGYGTIEFRQHEGTVDFERVCAWVKFVAAMVQWAGKVGEASVLPFAERSEDLGLEGVLRMVGGMELVGIYERRECVPHDLGGGRGEWARNEGGEEGGDDIEDGEIVIEDASSDDRGFWQMLWSGGHQDWEWLPDFSR